MGPNRSARLSAVREGDESCRARRLRMRSGRKFRQRRNSHSTKSWSETRRPKIEVRAGTTLADAVHRLNSTRRDPVELRTPSRRHQPAEGERRHGRNVRPIDRKSVRRDPIEEWFVRLRPAKSPGPRGYRQTRARQLPAPIHVQRGRIEVAADNDWRFVVYGAQKIFHLPPSPRRIPYPFQMHDTHRDAAAVDVDAREQPLVNSMHAARHVSMWRYGQRNRAKPVDWLRTQDRVADRAKLAAFCRTPERRQEGETHLERFGEPRRKFNPSMARHPPTRLAQQQGARIGQWRTRQTGEDRVEVRAAACVQDCDLQRGACGYERPVERHRLERRPERYGRWSLVAPRPESPSSPSAGAGPVNLQALASGHRTT